MHFRQQLYNNYTEITLYYLLNIYITKCFVQVIVLCVNDIHCDS